jgi:hypothetical protein
VALGGFGRLFEVRITKFEAQGSGCSINFPNNPLFVVATGVLVNTRDPPPSMPRQITSDGDVNQNALAFATKESDPRLVPIHEPVHSSGPLSL